MNVEHNMDYVISTKTTQSGKGQLRHKTRRVYFTSQPLCKARHRGNQSIYLHRSDPLLENGFDKPENRYGRYGFASFSAFPYLSLCVVVVDVLKFREALNVRFANVHFTF